MSRILSPIEDQSSIVRKKAKNSSKYQFVPPNEVAAQLNNQFYFDNESQQYFTLIYGVLNVDTHELRFVTAGHPSPISLQSGTQPLIIESNGLPIGFLKMESYQEKTIQLEKGQRLYFYSDGVTEVLNSKGELFGVKRLQSLLYQQYEKPLRNSLDSVLKYVEDWGEGQTEDDISILALEVE